ncbi:MAG: sodium:solute symporter [Pirellulales bacterium]
MSPRFAMTVLALCLLILALGAVPALAADAAAATKPAGQAPAFTGLAAVDWAVIAGYFGIIALLAVWSFIKNKDTADDYFLAGRGLGWFIIAASIFSSNIGSEHLVGLAGSGCTDGVAMAHYELHAWCLLVLAWVFVPFYLRSMVYTMPEFLERRFSPNARWFLSLISLVAYVVTKLAVGIFAGGVVFSVLMPELSMTVGSLTLDAFWLGSIAVIIATGVYTVIGGLRAVAYTDTFQTLVFIVSSAMVTVFGLMALDKSGNESVAAGWEDLRVECGSDMFNLWKPLVPEGQTATWAPVKEPGRIAWYFNDNFPWLGMLFCAPIVGLWYWCTDQYIVQRVLAAPNETVARRSSIAAAFMKLLPVFIFIIPGMICFALAKTGYHGLTNLVDAAGRPVRDQCQAAFPLLVKNVLPIGVRGLVVAGLLSALMSSLAGAFNASSTLFTMDFYRRFRQNAPQHELVWMGRIATVGMVLIALAWIPIIRGQKGLYFYLQSVQGYLAPPIFTVFFLGVFHKRLNSKGCMAALVVGFLMGIFRLAIDTPVLLKLSGYENGYSPGTFLWICNNIYFQYYSLLIFLVSVVVMVVVSYATAPPSMAQISGLTFGTITPEQRAASRASWTKSDVVASALVLLAIAAAYLYFTGATPLLTLPFGS